MRPKGAISQHHNGAYASNYDQWHINQGTSKFKNCNQFAEVDYDGVVWDVELPRNHTLLINHQGRIAWGSNCRTMCVTVEDEKGVNQGHSIPVKRPNKGPLPDHKATPEDFTGLAPKATTDEVDHWNTYVGLSPTQAITSMFGKDLEGQAIKMLKDGGIQFLAKGGMEKGGEYLLKTVYDPFSKVMYLTQAEFAAAPASDASAFFSRVLNGMIDTATSAGGTAITVGVSGSSAYHYAKMGFVPQPGEWQHIRLDAMDSLQGGKLSDAYAALDADQKDILLNLLSNPDEMSLQVLADLDWDINGKPIGSLILEGVDGAFSLDITDAKQIAKAKEYLL
jgi:hypothetical protein